MDDFLEVLGPDRVLCIAREITKLHETILTGPAGEIIEAVKTRSQKGEFVVVIAPGSFVL
jgi:16S rRNA (cytidine1402-2'-O)-methyltransferase